MYDAGWPEYEEPFGGLNIEDVSELYPQMVVLAEEAIRATTRPLAIYAMQDYLGEDVINGALAKLLREKSNVPPYPSAQDVEAELRQVTPAKCRPTMPATKLHLP